MRRDHSARRGDRLHGSAATKEEQHLLVRHAEHAEPLTGFEQAQSELILVEANRAGKIAGVKAGFDDAVDARGGHGGTPFQSEEESPLGVYRSAFWRRNVNMVHFPLGGPIPRSGLLRWDEKAGLQRDAIRSQGSTCSRHKEKETGL